MAKEMKEEWYKRLKEENRIGKFSITHGLLKNAPKIFIESIFKGIVIVRAESIWHEGLIEYIGYSDLFKPVEENCEATEYNFEFEKEGNHLKVNGVVEWQRKIFRI